MGECVRKYRWRGDHNLHPGQFCMPSISVGPVMDVIATQEHPRARRRQLGADDVVLLLAKSDGWSEEPDELPLESACPSMIVIVIHYLVYGKMIKLQTDT